MILRFPSGLYVNAVPHRPGDAGNVTWTMSGDPPKLTQIFPKLPPGIGNVDAAPSGIDDVTRRNALGAMVYSTTAANRTALGSSTKQYTTGQLLDFDVTVAEVADVSPLPGVGTDVQHDLNQLDYAKLGLTEAQRVTIELAGATAYAGLQLSVAAARQRHVDLQVAMSEDQKVVNETVAAVAALTVLAASPGVGVMLETLRVNLAAARARIAANVTAANAVAAEVVELQNQLTSLAQLVR